MALSKTMVLKIYTSVIEDVINNVKEVFADEGVDEHVLQELKMLWESKLMASKAVESHTETDKTKKVEMPTTTIPVYTQAVKTQQIVKPAQTIPVQQVVTTQQVQIQEDKMIPIQITLPAQPNVDIGPRVLTIQVPASALNSGQLHTLLTGPVISATMGLPAPLASSLLQQHVNAALQSQQQQQQQLATIKTVMPQTDGPSTSGLQHKRSKEPNSSKKRQGPIIEFVHRLVDGGIDSSDDEEDDVSDNVSEEDVEEEEDKEDEEPELDDHVAEEEPLNSEDDVTDEEPTDLFVTDNVVVCQYDKITRSRNKWKFYLKDGIMNLEGEDYVFHKANGDAEW